MVLHSSLGFKAGKDEARMRQSLYDECELSRGQDDCWLVDRRRFGIYLKVLEIPEHLVALSIGIHDILLSSSPAHGPALQARRD